MYPETITIMSDLMKRYPVTYKEWLNGDQLVVEGISIIRNEISYGNELGLYEVYNYINPSIGYLTAKQVVDLVEILLSFDNTAPIKEGE